MKNFDFFGAPVGIIVTCDRCIDVNGWGHVGAFLQSVCLLAEERGMGTCLQEAFATYHEVVYKELNIPREQIQRKSGEKKPSRGAAPARGK